MKYNKDHYFKIGINGLIVACGSMLLYYVLFQSDRLWASIHSVMSILTPFIAGLAIAYILNPVMVFLEGKFIYRIYSLISPDWAVKNPKLKKYTRIFCALFCIVLFLGALYGLIILIVPQLIFNIQTILIRTPIYLKNLQNYFMNLINLYPNLEDMFKDSLVDMNAWIKTIVNPALKNWISQPKPLFSSIVLFFKSIVNFIIGIIIAAYFLIDKEKFLAQCKKVLYAFLPEVKANNYINNFRYSNKVFSGFVTGKVIDSIIIGILCYISMLILKLPYPLLVSVIVGTTNVIPYFGPILGAVPGALIVFMVSPVKCLIFLIFLFLLQQFDGNILGPKILGESTGLSSFWVIFSITVFSSLFGSIGMFIGVPMFAVIYTAFRIFIEQKLSLKNMPTNTDFYMTSDYDTNPEQNTKNDGITFRFNWKLKKRRIDITDDIFEDEESDEYSDNSQEKRLFKNLLRKNNNMSNISDDITESIVENISKNINDNMNENTDEFD